MSELTKQESLERAKRSLRIAEERLKEINSTLPILESEFEDLILTQEIKGYKGRTLERTQSEIEKLQKERVTLEKTLEVLKKKLPELEKAAMLEIAESEVKAYEDALNDLEKLLVDLPTIDGIKSELEQIERYAKDLETAKTRVLTISRQLADFMVKENMGKIGDLYLQRLRDDREVDYEGVLTLSDLLIDIADQINQLQYSLFHTATNNPIEYRLPSEPKPEPMFSECGRFKIEKEEDSWRGYMKETHFASGVPFDSWKSIYSSKESITLNELQKIVDGTRVKERERVAKEKAREKIVRPPLEIYDL